VSAPVKSASAGDNKADVTKAVEAWAAAWARKDVKGYLAHYAKDFKTPGQTRAKWEAERRSRIDKPGTIEVKLEGISVSMNGDQATAKFRQHYKAGAFKASAGKTLDLVQHDGKWQIQQERVGG
jgi:ketosteroid isomerase-like protein